MPDHTELQNRSVNMTLVMVILALIQLLTTPSTGSLLLAIAAGCLVGAQYGRGFLLQGSMFLAASLIGMIATGAIAIEFYPGR